MANDVEIHIQAVVDSVAAGKVDISEFTKKLNNTLKKSKFDISDKLTGKSWSNLDNVAVSMIEAKQKIGATEKQIISLKNQITKVAEEAENIKFNSLNEAQQRIIKTRDEYSQLFNDILKEQKNLQRSTTYKSAETKIGDYTPFDDLLNEEKIALTHYDDYSKWLQETSAKLKDAEAQVAQLNLGSIPYDETSGNKILDLISQITEKLNELETTENEAINSLLQNGAIFSSEYNRLNDEITDLTSRLANYADYAQRLEETPGLASEVKWEQLGVKVEKTGQKIADVYAKMQEQVSSGEAFDKKFVNEQVIQSQTEQLNKFAEQYKETIKSLQSTVQINTSPYTAQYTSALKELDNIEKKINTLIAQTEIWESTNTGTEQAWRRANAELIKYGELLNVAKSKIDDLVYAGKAFKLGREAEGQIGLDILTQKHNELKDSMDNVRKSATEKAGALGEETRELYLDKEASEKTQKSINRLSTVFNIVKKVANNVSKSVKNTTKRILSLDKSSNSSSTSMQKSFKKLWRNILQFGLGFRSMYFLIKRLRSTAISTLQEMAKQVPSVNAQLSEFVTSLNQIKGSLATAFEPLLQYVIPTLVKLINVLNTATESIAKFFASLSGRDYIYKFTSDQIDYAKSLDSTASSAEKAQKSLMGFDEINRLDDNSDSSSSSDISGTWSKEDFTPTDFMNEIKEAWENADFTEIGKTLAEKLSNAFSYAENWLNNSYAPFMQKLANSLSTFINGFTSVAELAENAGSLFATGINTTLNAVDKFLTNTKWSQVGSFIADTLMSAINNINWALMGKTIGDGLRSVINVIWSFLNGVDFEGIGKHISDGINNALSAMSEVDKNGLTGWQKLGQSFSKGIEGFLTTIKTIFKEVDWQSVGKAIGEFISSIDWSQVIIDLIGLVWNIVKAIGSTLKNWADTSPISLGMATLLGIAFGVVNVGSKLLNLIPILDKLGIPLKTILSLFGKIVKFASPIVAAISGLIAIFSSLTDMIENGVNWCNSFINILGAVLLAVAGVAADIVAWPAIIVAAVVAAVVNLTVAIVQHWEEIKAFFNNVGEWIEEKWSNFKDKIKQVWETIKTYISNALDKLKEKFTGFFTFIENHFSERIQALKQNLQNLITGVKEILNGIVTYVSGVFKGNWKQAWESVKQAFKGVWDTLVAICKAPINSMIGLINQLLKAIVNSVNKVISGLNSLNITIPDWVPSLGGKSLGFNFKQLTAYQIPLLAKGAVLPPNNPFLSIVGDQKSGTNIEAPLDTIRQAVAEVMDEQLEALMTGFEAIVSAINNKDLNVAIGDKEIGKAAERYTKKQNLIKGVG